MVQANNPKKEKLLILIADDVQETRRNTRLMIATMDNVEVTAIASNGRPTRRTPCGWCVPVATRWSCPT